LLIADCIVDWRSLIADVKTESEIRNLQLAMTRIAIVLR
jgi:hypothetical protein